MTGSNVGDVTTLLRAIHAGRPGAANDLMELIYGELRKIAQKKVGHRPARVGPQPTALVHEAYLRLFGKSQPTWEDRHHFFWAAARAMHDVLVEEARRHAARKRGGDQRHVELPDEVALREQSHEMIGLSEALTRLEQSAPDAAQVVMLRFFGGLTHEQTAEVLGVSEPTVRRRWAFARAWLHRELSPDSPTQTESIDP